VEQVVNPVLVMDMVLAMVLADTAVVVRVVTTTAVLA
jgi:hypothetical protein